MGGGQRRTYQSWRRLHDPMVFQRIANQLVARSPAIDQRMVEGGFRDARQHSITETSDLSVELSSAQHRVGLACFGFNQKPQAVEINKEHWDLFGDLRRPRREIGRG